MFPAEKEYVTLIIQAQAYQAHSSEKAKYYSHESVMRYVTRC